MKFDASVAEVAMLFLSVNHNAIIIASINPASNEPIMKPCVKQEQLSDHGQYLEKNDKEVHCRVGNDLL